MNLTINAKDARAEWGLTLLDGGVAALLAPAQMKSWITVSSRLQHGERPLTASASGAPLGRVAARDVTLPFAITGSGYAQTYARLSALMAELERGICVLRAPQLPDLRFRLLLQSCTAFSQVAGQLLKFSIRFREPNPKDRG